MQRSSPFCSSATNAKPGAVSGNQIRWTAELDTAQLRALYASMIRIRRLPAGDQRRIPDQISLLGDHDFADRVRRPLITAMYTGRRLDRDASAQAGLA